MSHAAKKKEERIDIRVDDETKELIEKAASIAGMTVSSFTLYMTLHAAKEKILEHGRLSLSNADRDLFIDTVLNPPKANKALRKAMTKLKGKYR